MCVIVEVKISMSSKNDDMMKLWRVLWIHYLFFSTTVEYQLYNHACDSLTIIVKEDRERRVIEDSSLQTCMSIMHSEATKFIMSTSYKALSHRNENVMTQENSSCLLISNHKQTINQCSFVFKIGNK